MIDYRAKALSEIVGEYPTKIKLGLYTWRCITYEVKPYSAIKKKGNRGGNITKYVYVTVSNIKFGIRELKGNYEKQKEND